MPSIWPGIEPATLGIEGQRYTNLPIRSLWDLTKRSSPETPAILMETLPPETFVRRARNSFYGGKAG
ncbi:hypothetical protein ANN_13420 [Periplaneta americana]|uniref:Uncharacterized protein n=1 Tax=Periplaneta americana TaxID=6978 RepID=A0ABQ8TKC7_PERAM|nr:hypothetical protein ANN_13420 [Periplaneta americana]